jgi:cytosine/adenosine deaminase-related metal-dependent hydrolase
VPARRLAADWLIPVRGAPVRDGALLIGGDGRIAAAGPSETVPAPPGAVTRRFPGAVLVPGLVNTHTHLELTGLGGRIAADSFAEWIGQLRRLKEARSREDFLAAARQGIANCFAAGVTTVADTGDSGTVIEALADAGGSGIAYLEVFGPHPDQCAESLADLQRRAEALRPFATERVRLGVSPHAPYSVSGPLFRAASAWARSAGLPLAVHIAESPEELALLADGSGAFAAAWSRRAIPMPEPAGDSPIAWLARHEVLGPDLLCIHVVHADTEDVARLARAGTAVAHCPLSNAAHVHGTASLGALLDAGIRVGCGTDSVASVGALDLLAEVRAARGIAGLGPEAAFRLCTLDAARAIGLDGEIGSLEAGKWGDAAVIAIGKTADPLEAVLASAPDDVLSTWVGGEEKFERVPAPARLLPLRPSGR